MNTAFGHRFAIVLSCKHGLKKTRWRWPVALYLSHLGIDCIPKAKLQNFRGSDTLHSDGGLSAKPSQRMVPQAELTTAKAEHQPTAKRSLFLENGK